VFRAVDLGLVRLFSKVCSTVDSPRGRNDPNACHTQYFGSQYQLTQMLAAEHRFWLVLYCCLNCICCQRVVWMFVVFAGQWPW